MKVAGAIIAGGPAKRLGGVAKPFLKVGGHAIAERQLDLFRGAGLARVFVVANDPAPWAPLGIAVVPDLVGGMGPLGGVHAALTAAADCDAVICLAGDLPFVAPACSRRCATARPGPSGRAAFGARNRAAVRPLRAGALPIVDARVRAGELAIHELLEQGGDADRGGRAGRAGSGWPQLFNVNTPEDLARADAMAAESGGGPVTTRGWAVAVSVALLLIVGAPFFTATTFHGDDHVFLAFARHAPHPFVAFVFDAHGGEYYPPLPMLVWWLLGRPGLGSVPFAAVALGLHAGAAALTGLLLRSLGRPVAVVYGAAVLMLLAPQKPDAAYWFSANTDLLATVFVLGSLIAIVRGRLFLAAALGSPRICPRSRPTRCRCWLCWCWAACRGGGGWRRSRLSWRCSPWSWWCGSASCTAGAGRATRARASGRSYSRSRAGSHTCSRATGSCPRCWRSAWARRSSRSSRSPRSGGGRTPAPACCRSRFARSRRAFARSRVGGRRALLLSAGGRAGLGGGGGLASAGIAARVAIACVVVIVGGLQAVQRRADVVSYDRRVAAARRVVGSGLASGYRVFNIMSGVKDLDLAVKEDPRLADHAGEVLVLTDVPASFVIVPAALAPAAAPLLAQPPLPPLGAYQFGDARVVGLARREDGPSLREVWQRFPDIRFVRLRPVPSGQIIARDVTDETRQRLAAEGLDDAGLDDKGNAGQD